MCKIAWRACVALVVLGLTFASAGYAKPPDLPVDLGVEFDQADNARSITLGYDFVSGNLLWSFSLPWKFVLPWQVAPREQVKTDSKVEEGAKPQAACRQQARALFATAERCMKNGDLDKARTCYEETHLLAPETRVGRRAIERLSEIDNRGTFPVTGAGEEQEPVSPAAPRSRN